MSRFTASINPKFLSWARTEAGYEAAEIANKLKIPEPLYISWERSGNNIPFGKLKQLSNYYKRQTAAFFLEKIPETKKKPTDFRNLSSEQKNLSKKMLLTLRRAHQIRDAAVELESKEYWDNKYEWLSELGKFLDKDSYSQINLQSWLRELIQVDIDQQIAAKDSRELYNLLRKQIEKELGILVLQFSFPMNEAHGFSLIEKKPFIIVTNSQHTYNGRVFTIFHELAHIFNHESSICFIDHLDTSNQIEFGCNQFAGEFLLPNKYVDTIDNIEQLKKYSNRFNVSREVYLRRVKDKGLITESFFFDLLSEIKESYSYIKKPGGFAPPELKSRASRGPTFFNMVLEGISNNRVTYTEASQLLDLKINRILNEL